MVDFTGSCSLVVCWQAKERQSVVPGDRHSQSGQAYSYFVLNFHSLYKLLALLLDAGANELEN